MVETGKAMRQNCNLTDLRNVFDQEYTLGCNQITLTLMQEAGLVFLPTGVLTNPGEASATWLSTGRPKKWDECKNSHHRNFLTNTDHWKLPASETVISKIRDKNQILTADVLENTLL